MTSNASELLIENLNRLLKSKGWKIPQLSDATGISASGLYGIANGSRWPSADNLDRIAKALGTHPSQLLARHRESPTSNSIDSEMRDFMERRFAELLCEFGMMLKSKHE